MTKINQNNPTHKNRRPKEPEWIDLETDILEDEDDTEQEETPVRSAPKKKPAGKKHSSKKKKSGFNLHIVFLTLIAIVFVVVVFKLMFWDKRVRQSTDRENDTTLSFDTEPLDSIVPLDSSSVGAKEKDDDLRILFLGNGSLADDKDSDSNMANIKIGRASCRERV